MATECPVALQCVHRPPPCNRAEGVRVSSYSLLRQNESGFQRNGNTDTMRDYARGVVRNRHAEIRNTGQRWATMGVLKPSRRLRRLPRGSHPFIHTLAKQ